MVFVRLALYETIQRTNSKKDLFVKNNQLRGGTIVDN